MRRTTTIIAFFVVHFAAAQDSAVIDSLHRSLATASHDSTRFKAYMALAGQYLFTAPDSAEACCIKARAFAGHTGRPGDLGEAEGWLGYLAEQRGAVQDALVHYRRSLAQAEAISDSNGIRTVLNNLGAIYKDQGLVADAMAAHERSLAIASVRKDSSAIATSHNNIGLLDQDLGKIAEATEHYAEALRIYERIGDDEGTATALHNIAGVYRDQGDLEQALPYFARALVIDKNIGDIYSQASTEDNIGGVYEAQHRYSEAMQHLRSGFALHDSVDDARGRGYSLRNMASVRLKQGNAEEALSLAERSLKELTAADDKRGRASAMLMTGLACEKLGRSDEAMHHGSAALVLARELGYPLIMRDAAALLDRSYRAQGKWKEALGMHDLFMAMRDSVANQDTRRASIRQQYKYAYEQKEAGMKADQERKDLLAREQLQQEKNRRNLLLFSGSALLLFAVGLWSRLRFVRRSRTAIQREKDVSEGLLLNILPAEVAAELKQKGHAEAREFVRATILFTDFKGFTSMTEKLSATELVSEIDHCFKAFDAIMERYHIEKIKTIGDAYMAVGGLPVPEHGPPRDVVLAALDMQGFMTSYKQERSTQGKPFFEMRVGIHTGPVIAGIVGVKKFAYDIWGDAVNIASRMESSGEVGHVNISEATYGLLKDQDGFQFTSRGKVLAKGKGEMEMYFVERSNAQA